MLKRVGTGSNTQKWSAAVKFEAGEVISTDGVQEGGGLLLREGCTRESQSRSRWERVCSYKDTKQTALGANLTITVELLNSGEGKYKYPWTVYH